MNCIQAQNISIKIVLESFSLFPSKENSKTAFYFAFDREEKTPSLSVDFVKNSAFDFGTGKKYDNISLVQAIKFCTVSEALKYLEKFDLQKPMVLNGNLERKYKIIEFKEEISHPALIEYLVSRKINFVTNYLQEIHYEISGKKYFGIAFKNDSGGFEIRNKYAKICLGKKDITSIKNDSKKLRIFEGFFDFMTFKKIENVLAKETSDYVILNSISLIFRIKMSLEIYDEVELFLDYDSVGDSATLEIKKWFPNAEDCRVLYKGFKDLNEWVCRGLNS